MIRLFFLNFWSNIKRSPFVALILFIQLVLFSYGLYGSLWEQSNAELNNTSFQGIYSNYSNYSIACKIIDGSMIQAANGFNFVSADDTGFEMFEALHEKIMEYDEIKTATLNRTQLNLYEEFEDIPMNQFTSDYYSFYQPIESVPPTYQPNTFMIDQNFIDNFNVTLDSGRLFTESEFYDLDPTCVPVLMGSDYKEFFSVGDTFNGTLFLGEKPMTFKIIGFIGADQVFLIPGESSPYFFDNHIFLPQISKTVPEWLEFYENNSEYIRTTGMMWSIYTGGLGTTGFVAERYLLVEIGKEEAFTERMNQIFDEIGGGDYYQLSGLPSSSMQIADNIDEKNAMLTMIILIMLVFSHASIVFSAINNASNNIKAYAIHNLIGATRANILLYSIVETLIYSVMGLSVGFILYYLNLIKWDSTVHPATEPAAEKWFATAIIFTVLSCVLSIIFVYIKIRSYSVAELIRGREIKKKRSVPLYKGITFVMFLLSSVCITFINSYNWQIEHIDKYQNNFWGNKGYLVYLSAAPGENKPDVEFEYDIEGLNDYSIDIMLNLTYRPFEAPRIRGWYHKGDIEVPQVTEGRFFTDEELSQVSNYAVVGKNVLEEFVSEEDGMRKFTYENKTYEVIGIVGREGHYTTVDDWVFITVPTVFKNYPTTGTRLSLVDGKSEEIISSVRENIKMQAEGKYLYEEMTLPAQLDLNISKDTLQIFVILILLTSTVFCIYYIDKVKYIINVKKFLGYSRAMIFADTAAQFIAISTVAFGVGNAAMWVLSKTVLKDIVLFSAYQINLPVLALSFGIILLIAFLFSIIAINKSFRGSARDLKRNQ